MSINKLNELLQPLVESLGYEFVGLEYSNNPKNSVLRIYIDRENGVTIEDCEKVSRETAALLDVKDPISGHYNLEVSSPGLDRPLFTLAHYIKYSGQQAKINLYSPVNGRRKFQGKILLLNDDVVGIEQDGVAVELDINNISSARLIPDYENILAASRANL